MKYFATIVFACLLVLAASSAIKEEKINEEKRQLTGIVDTITDLLKNAANSLVQKVALALTQLLANIGNGSINLGKRQSGGLFDTIANLVSEAANKLFKDLALKLTELLANIGSGNVSIGKRQVGGGGLIDSITNLFKETVNKVVKDLALKLTQLLANIGNGSVGKRQEGGIFDTIFNLVSEAANKVVKDLALKLTEILAGIGSGNISIGKRDAAALYGFADFLTDFGKKFLDGLKNNEFINQLVKDIGLKVTQVLANLSQGKRDLSSVFSSFLQELINRLVAFINQLVNVQPVSYNLNQELQSLKDILDNMKPPTGGSGSNIVGK